MKTTEELTQETQEIIELKQQLESTIIADERHKIQKQILDKLASMYDPHIKLK